MAALSRPPLRRPASSLHHRTLPPQLWPAAHTRGATSPAAAPPAGPAATSSPTFGLFVHSGSPAVAEALAHTGVDWLCLDAQHGAVGYAELLGMLQATASGRTQTIVRVGGPSDRFGIQQALDQGADGVMVPLVNSAAEAAEAVSYCRYPPAGKRSLISPSRAILTQEGIGPQALGRYLRSADRRVQVWLQVETVQCLDSLEAILSSVPGIDCMFLGPADMAVSMGLMGGGGPLAAEREAGAAAAGPPDLAAALAGPAMAEVNARLLQACARHGVAAGTFCVGAPRAKQLAAEGFRHVGFDTDLNMLINTAAAAVQGLK